MFERFTEKARRVVVAAQDHARQLRHEEVTLWDMLLGLRDSDGIAGQYLANQYPAPEDLLRKVQALDIDVRPEVAIGQIALSPFAKKALEGALREALSMGHNYVGTEHLLLSICKVADSDTPLIPPFASTQQDIVAILSGARGISAPLLVAWPQPLEQAATDYCTTVEKVVALIDNDDGVRVADLRAAVREAAEKSAALLAELDGLNVHLRRS